MQRETPQGQTQCLVDPNEVATQPANNIRLESGLISPHTLYVAQEGTQKIIVEHGPRKKTAIFLDGSEQPLIVPLPDLLMFRIASEKRAPSVSVSKLPRVS